MRIGERVIEEGDVPALDGNDGRTYAGQVEVVERRPVELLATVNAWRAEAASEGTPALPSAARRHLSSPNRLHE